ncbi:hypothetical protein JCM15519_05300 [Fundidesulfovibrio butyratiphilus]
MWLLRRLVAALLISAILAGQAFAQDRRDGHYWRNVPESEKLDLILGIFDGMLLTESIVQTVLKRDYTLCTDLIESIMRQTDSYMADLSVTQIAQRLDEFYEDPVNRNIPIFWSVWVVARQSKNDKTVNKLIRELRKAYK